MDFYELKNMILEKKLSNEFKKVNKSFLEIQISQKISEIPRLGVSVELIRIFD
jgi:hypothetical protein